LIEQRNTPTHYSWHVNNLTERTMTRRCWCRAVVSSH
jgi:hypothetical protein